ncbi:MAG: hypothetical protein Q9226_003816 [Calogaya cf. arnoldii]
METDLYGAREIGVNFSKKELVDPNRMKFYRFSPASNMGLLIHGQSIHLSLIDVDLVKGWYRECLDRNCSSNALPHKTGSLPKGFRVIDVQRYCIVDAEPGCQYIALSYVWGNVGGLQNLQRHRKDLEKDDAIRDRIEYLPNTIQDAISFTRSIGVRYLWVDSLCIVQDDLEDKMNQITATDQIYSSASLTLAATSGANANVGLSGTITRPRDFHQPIVRLQGIYLANRPLVFERAVNHSVWNTRAWTFQERVMSPRTLYVAEQRCFFACQCRSVVLTEGTDTIENGISRKSDLAEPDTSRMGDLLPSSQSINILTYNKLVEAYTSRFLSYPSDILNAFKGIEALLQPLFRGDLIYGLPRSELDYALLSQPKYSLTRRLDLQTGTPLFPSWSWVGWIGEVVCNGRENLSRVTWIEDSGERYTTENFRYPAKAKTDDMKRILFRMGWREALTRRTRLPYYFEEKTPNERFLNPTAVEESRRLAPNTKGITDHLVFEAETTDAHNIDLDHYWPMSGLASERCSADNHQLCPLGLRSPEGYLGGYLKIPGEIFTRFLNDSVNGTWPLDVYEFVMISRAMAPQQEDRGETNPGLLVDAEAIDMEKTSFVDRPVDHEYQGYGFDWQQYDARKPWCLYNIMLVEWKDGIAYRLGVGQMHIDAWAQAHPIKKIIELGKAPKPIGLLVAPKARIEALPGTSAGDIYARLRQLRIELSLAIDHAGEQSLEEADFDGTGKLERTPTLFTRWVDYTRSRQTFTLAQGPEHSITVLVDLDPVFLHRLSTDLMRSEHLPSNGCAPQVCICVPCRPSLDLTNFLCPPRTILPPVVTVNRRSGNPRGFCQ